MRDGGGSQMPENGAEDVRKMSGRRADAEDVRNTSGSRAEDERKMFRKRPEYVRKVRGRREENAEMDTLQTAGVLNTPH